ncbi:helix-turn-helix transcriptional regulator [Aidingimonas lacisalsi]|uniref:helix-turn-helix transcriptional regulator n=1 Tax=Aidingimonas lacisalsi TaxID=2604086 RepID=UPI0011D288A3
MLNDMMRAEIWLQERLGSREGIDELAERLGYSASQVRRNFKHCFGVSPRVYREKLRLEHATMLLAFSQRSIQSIARLCGYQNHSAFTRTFTQRFQTTPRQYRNEQQNALETRFRMQKQEFDVTIHRSEGLQTIVTRLYDDQGLGDSPQRWPSRTCLSNLPERLLGNAFIAVIHGHPLNAKLQRADLGIAVDSNTAEEFAPPLPFRKLSLPYSRYASVCIQHAGQWQDALTYLLATNLLEGEECISGLPINLCWTGMSGLDEDERRTETLEMRLPLVDR